MRGIWHKGQGSGERVQRNLYAYRVSMAMTGGASICPACLTPTDYMAPGAVEVDRTLGAERDEQGRETYRAGSILYVCRACNQSRSILQEQGRDWTRADDYARDVATASGRVEIPTVREAREWWANRGTFGSQSRYA